MKSKTTVEYLTEYKINRSWLPYVGYSSLTHARERLEELNREQPSLVWRLIKLTTTTQVKREVVR